MRRLAFVALLLLTACKQHGPRVYVQPHYAPDASGLHALWADILDAAIKDDRDRVHDLMATTLLSDAEMKRLFGAKADALLPRYHMLMGNLINRGSVELVANVYEHKYNAVDAFAAEDPTVAAAFVEPHAMFAARVRKKNEERGLRYDGYFVLDGTWKTVNQLGKFIEVVPPPSGVK
ncbi:MAG TPA: hypothetical protein VGL86_12525 [Polyangia bacterium]|jgi:hypothetical protein